MKFRALLTDFAWPDVSIERELLAAGDIELIVAPAGDEPTLQKLAVDVDAIMTCWARVTAAVIDAAPRLKIVSRLGIGLDNIDVAHGRQRGVIVTNVPDYCLHEVAEHTLALLLALARKVTFYAEQTRARRYDLAAGLPLRRVAGQTLGLVGFGQIAQRVAEKSRSLGLTVLATTQQRRTLPEGVEWCTLDELLARSDYVSLHVPSTPATQRLIAAPQLARMKPTAYLINTARGAIVDEAALAAALSAGKLAGAALDVQQHEPPDLSLPPFNDPRVIVTPHVAFVSTESVNELRERTATQVVDALHGRRPANIITAPGIA